MRVAAEALEEARHLLVHHGVARDAVVEIGLLRLVGQFAVEQQIAGLEKVAVLGELLDREAAIEQHALVAVDIGDLGFAARRRGEAGIVGEHAGLAVELADVDDARADRPGLDRQLDRFVVDDDRAGIARSWSLPSTEPETADAAPVAPAHARQTTDVVQLRRS